MAQTFLEPLDFVLDMGSMNNWVYNIASDKEANICNLRMYFQSSKK